MRPTPNELVAGVRRILKEVIEPELVSDHARQRLAEVRAALAQVDWDEAGLRLAAATASRREFLTAMRDWCHADASAASFLEPWLPDVARAIEGDLGTTFHSLNEQHDRCGVALVQVTGALETWMRAHDDDVTAKALWERLLVQLRQPF
jgi:hypothetical protein